MTHLAFDLRTTHYSGIYRYGTSLLHALDADEINGDYRLTAIAWPGRSGEIAADLKNPRLTRRLRFVEVPDDSGFVRDSSWLRNWLIREGVNLYYSIHYRRSVAARSLHIHYPRPNPAQAPRSIDLYGCGVPSQIRPVGV